MSLHNSFAIFWFCILSIEVKSQNILQPGNEWIFEFNDNVFGFPHPTQTIESITIGNDTLINGTTYTKLIASIGSPCGVWHVTEHVRSEGNKVFRFIDELQEETQIIDFDETVGYEIFFKGLSGTFDTAMAIVDSFGIEYAYDGTPFETQYLRILNNQSFDDEAVYKVYKGFGFYQGGMLFPDLGTGLCDIFEWAAIRCFITGQDTVQFSEFDCYESSIIMATEEVNLNEVLLYPNPTTGLIHLPENLELLSVVNMQGLGMTFQKENNTIDLEDFPSGIYFLHFQSESGNEFHYARVMRAD